MPVRPEPYEVRGVNLHPFFAGLLPEGLRLASLVKRAKTSPDDLFSLLAAVGTDAVGDVWVALAPADRAAVEPERAPWVDPRALTQASYAELLATHLELGEPVSIAGAMPKLSAARVALPLRSASRSRQYLLKLAPRDHPRLVGERCQGTGVRCQGTVPGTVPGQLRVRCQDNFCTPLTRAHTGAAPSRPRCSL